MSPKHDILSDLRGENNFAFGELYNQYFTMVGKFVVHNNGSWTDAEDIFQDTMVVLIEKLRSENFLLTASVKTYIMAIAKHLWLKRLRSSKRETYMQDYHYEQIAEEIDESIDNEKSYRDKLQYFLTKVTDHCKTLVHDMFFKNKSIEQIQEDYGYSNKHNAQNQKHKCMKQIKRVKEQSEKG